MLQVVLQPRLQPFTIFCRLINDTTDTKQGHSMVFRWGSDWACSLDRTCIPPSPIAKSICRGSLAGWRHSSGSPSGRLRAPYIALPAWTSSPSVGTRRRRMPPSSGGSTRIRRSSTLRYNPLELRSVRISCNTCKQVSICLLLLITPFCLLFVCFSSICLFVHSFICSFIHSFVRSFIRLFIRSFIHFVLSIIHSIVHLFVRSFVCSFIRPFIRSFLHLSVYSIIRSFAFHPFICTFVYSSLYPAVISIFMSTI